MSKTETKSLAERKAEKLKTKELAEIANALLEQDRKTAEMQEVINKTTQTQ